MKKYLLALPVLSAFSVVANAALPESITIGGGAEVDLYGRTNQDKKTDKQGVKKSGFTVDVEAVITLNIDGKHDVGFGDLVWRLAQRAATDYRYDLFGAREAWMGISNDTFGTLTAGNQFSVTYLAMDSVAGAGSWDLFSSLGGQNSQYTRSIKYVTPSIAGLTLTGQMDLGAYESYAADMVVNYKMGDMLDINVGGSYTANNMFKNGYWASQINHGERGTFGSKMNDKSTDAPDSYVAFVTAKYMMDMGNDNKAGLALGYKYNNVGFVSNDGTTPPIGITTMIENLNSHQVLAMANYTFGKNDIALGYQIITGIEGDIKTNGTKTGTTTKTAVVHGVYAQYTRMIAEKAKLFVQVKHRMWDKDKKLPTYSLGDKYNNTTDHDDKPGRLDGAVIGKDSVTRVLVGVWVGF